ncbi:hypothetical protein BT63DRAFT_459662 [Microthyrium microscopicum]|uniref:Uncharacterized protein n=1 Tax=Microthyrium microscopicum TaxID=703497 RepID=A0A6A6TZB5_9PEZI|nr:hypothetical protein BT63DRAFT_459662 [Microthyrium microscopicum]
MPFDKNSNNNKPLLPRIAGTKSPITPRLAAQHLRASPSPSVASVTSSRSDTNGIRSPIVKDDLNTPVKALLGGNITPRSSSRKSRIDSTSTHTTPTGTPVQTPTQDAASRSRASAHVGWTANKRPHSVVGDGNASARSPLVRATTFSSISKSGSNSPREGLASPTELNGSSFFHASDAKNLEPIPLPPLPKKVPSFFYANGQQEENEALRMSRAPSPPLSNVSARSSKSQFYHANGKPETNSVPPLPSIPGRVTSPELRPTASRTDSSSSVSFSNRPPSPQKSGFHLTYRKGVSQVLPKRTVTTVPILPPLEEPSSPKESTSILGQLNRSPRAHARAGSLSSIDTSSSSRKSSLTALDTQLRNALHARGSPTSAPAVARLPPPRTSHPTSIDLSQDVRPNTSNSNSNQASYSLPQSPTSQPNLQLTGFAEAAANARRERKVLDLEISNSSLLAINRQLEREVRRQKSELRRFRRLSRAGRLSSLGSMMPATGDEDEMLDSDVDESVKDKLSHSGDDLYDLDEDDDQDLSLSDESVESSLMSPLSLSQRDSTRLAKDEKRLQLDLDKHRQLLIDSQKMNQSLKRCMAWTEDMIAEGRRALAYKVRVSDIKLGGRVLQQEDMSNLSIHDETAAQSPEDEVDDDEPEQRKGLLGSWSPPDSTTPLAAIMNATDGLLGLAMSFDGTFSPADDIHETGSSSGAERDSGVHVDESHHLLDSKVPGLEANTHPPDIHQPNAASLPQVH